MKPHLLLWIALLGLSALAAPPAPEKELAARLQRDLVKLSVERNYIELEALNASADWIESELVKAGHKVDRQVYRVGKTDFINLETRTPKGKPTLVVGAHYDSVRGSPGANDNGSGVVAALALARRVKPGRLPVRYVFFANEEPPFFQRESMGSVHYARLCKDRGDKIEAMLSLETLGYYSDEPGSQRFPDPAMTRRFGDKGNFLAIVGNEASDELVKSLQARWRAKGKFPVQALVASSSVPGVGWSDHWSFWQEGYPAVMLTDTALYRYPFYHTNADTPDKVNTGALARVVLQLEAVLESW